MGQMDPFKGGNASVSDRRVSSFRSQVRCFSNPFFSHGLQTRRYQTPGYRMLRTLFYSDQFVGSVSPFVQPVPEALSPPPYHLSLAHCNRKMREISTDQRRQKRQKTPNTRKFAHRRQQQLKSGCRPHRRRRRILPRCARAWSSYSVQCFINISEKQVRPAEICGNIFRVPGGGRGRGVGGG